MLTAMPYLRVSPFSNLFSGVVLVLLFSSPLLLFPVSDHCYIVVKTPKRKYLIVGLLEVSKGSLLCCVS